MIISVIVNRSSGNADSLDYVSELRKALSDHIVEFHETKGPGDATVLARKLLSADSKYIMIVGGDGTINEVAQSLVGSSKVMVPVPSGTGSDFCRTLGINDVKDSVGAVTSGRIISCDIALCKWGKSRRYFVNILEIGFGASVMERVNRRRRKGKSVFRRSVMRQLLSLKNYTCRIESDGHTVSIITPEIIVANGNYFGGGMMASPGSSVSDGFLDIHIIGKIGRLSLLKRFSRLIDGTYVKDKDVINMQAKYLSVSGSGPIEMDGEVTGKLPMRIEIVQSSLLVGVPEDKT